MGFVLGPVLAVLACAVLVVLVREWTRYRRGEHVISGRQMAVRAVTGALLVGLLGMVAVGVRIGFQTFDAAMAYWGVAMSLAALAIASAIWDLGQVRRWARKRRAESYGRLSGHIRQLERSRPSEQAGGK